MWGTWTNVCFDEDGSAPAAFEEGRYMQAAVSVSSPQAAESRSEGGAAESRSEPLTAEALAGRLVARGFTA